MADLALLRDEVVLDEGDERRPQWRTKQYPRGSDHWPRDERDG
jgi:hypothetical protein